MTNQQLPVIVAGGGIGGLAAALALVRQGFSVKVLEQAPEIGSKAGRRRAKSSFSPQPVSIVLSRMRKASLCMTRMASLITVSR